MLKLKHHYNPQQTGNIDCGGFVCAYATLIQLDLECKLLDQTHNRRMRLYIANVVLANETLRLTQVHLRDIPPRQGTARIVRQGQHANTLEAHDERKQKINGTDKDTISKRRQTGTPATKVRKRRKPKTNGTK